MTRKLRLFLQLSAAISLAMLSACLYAQEQPLALTSLAALPNASSESGAQQPSSSTQQPSTPAPSEAQKQQEPGPDTKLPETSKLEQSSAQTPVSKEQPKRILWVIPNYRAVSADANVPPLDAKGKFKLFFDDSFDYSTFIYVGLWQGLVWPRTVLPNFTRAPPAMDATTGTTSPIRR